MDEPLPSARRILTNPRVGTYLLTWTTYGSWLPGSESGFIGRVRDADGTQHNLNRRGDPVPGDTPALRIWSREKLECPPVVLDPDQANVVFASFRACASRHEMRLGAVAIMPTHIHMVIRTVQTDAQESMRVLKGSSAHDLGPRTAGRWWTRGGSARLLVDNPAIQRAMDYVRLQDNPLLVWIFERKAQEPAG